MNIQHNIHSRSLTADVPRIAYFVSYAVVIIGLISVMYEWEFLYIGLFFSAAFLIIALARFDWALLIVAVTLANPYKLTETGTNLHISDLALGIVFVIWFARMSLVGGRFVFPKEFLVPALLLIAACSLSLIGARYTSVGFSLLVRDIEILIFFFMVMLHGARSEKAVAQLFLFLIIGGLIASCIGIGQFMTRASEMKEVSRVFGWHGGGYGAVISTTLVLCISALQYDKNTFRKFFALLTIPFAVVALILSQTRTWIGALLVVLGLMFFVKKRKSISRLVLVIGLVVGTVIVLVMTNAFGLIDSRVIAWVLEGVSRFGETPGQRSTTDLALFLRFKAWYVAVEHYISNPILGIGIGNLRFVDYVSLRLGEPGDGVGYVDNQYLQFFAESGTIAGIAWIMYVANSVRVGAQAVQKTLGTELHFAAIGFLGCLFIFVIGSFFWVVTPEYDLFALMILYVALLINIRELGSKALQNRSQIPTKENQ